MEGVLKIWAKYAIEVKAVSVLPTIMVLLCAPPLDYRSGIA
jgi:hypothetical protein